MQKRRRLEVSIRTKEGGEGSSFLRGAAERFRSELPSRFEEVADA